MRASGRRGPLTCVQRQVSGESLLPAEHLAAHRAGEELLVQPPLGDPVPRLPVVLLRVCSRNKMPKSLKKDNRSVLTSWWSEGCEVTLLQIKGSLVQHISTS